MAHLLTYLQHTQLQKCTSWKRRSGDFSSGTIKLSLAAASFVENTSRLFNSLTFHCFSLLFLVAKVGILGHCLVTKKTYLLVYLKLRPVSAFPSFIKLHSSGVNFSFLDILQCHNRERFHTLQHRLCVNLNPDHQNQLSLIIIIIHLLSFSIILIIPSPMIACTIYW